MKLEKQDISKVLMLLGVFIIGLGIFINAMKKDEKKEKIEWKDTAYEEEKDYSPSEEDPIEIEDTGEVEGE